MARFVIPKGEDYTFNITVKEADSFIAQDLSGSTSTFQLIDPFNNSNVGAAISGTIVGNPINGTLKFVLTANTTNSLDATEKGGKVDWYYARPRYKGVVKVTGFTDTTVPDVFATIDKIYVV